MTWLITGASGQLGLAMQAELIARNLEFLAFDSKSLDITNQHEVEVELSKNSPKVVVNCAAWTDVDGAETNADRAFFVNATGAKHLASASKHIGATFVHVSTDYVFSGENHKPWQEDDERKPTTVYGLSKKAGEIEVHETYGEGSYIIRTAWLYSPSGKNFAKTMLKLALAAQGEIKVVNDQIGQPTCAKDLAKQIVDVVSAKADFGIYHGTNTGSTSWFDFAQEIFRLAGADTSRLTPVSSTEFPRPAKRPKYSVLGHENWNKCGLQEMRNWQDALAQEFPLIVNQLKKDVMI
jgi:dTDP-4-dehydrorhamnose reductase